MDSCVPSLSPNTTYLISLPEFNLPLIGSLTWFTPPGPYKATTRRGEGINLWTTYILFKPHNGGFTRMRDQLNAEATSETAQTWKTTHTRHTLSSFQQGEYEMMIMAAKWYSGTFVDLKFPDICLTGEEKPRKNLTQETCTARGSNWGQLRDRRACYRVFHSDITTYRRQNCI